MKKLIILLSIFLMLLSVTSVSAWGLFGDDSRIECEQFSMEIPEGYHQSSEWTDNFFEDFIYVWNDADDNKPDRDLEIWEIPPSDSFNRSNTEQVFDSYEEDGIKIDKCYDPEETVIVDGDSVHGANYTYAEFSKEGHNYVIINEFNGDLDDINMKEDVELIKTLRESIKQK